MGFLPVLALLPGLLLAPPAQDKVKIKDLRAGKGRAVVATDVLTVQYRGTLANGKEFDSSKGKAPFVFALGAGQVISGWDQGLLGMKVGGKRELIIPPSLAYGDAGTPGSIPPKATLKFEIELLYAENLKEDAKVEIKVLKEGEGVASKAGDTVGVHYRGTFLNGFPFDNSYDRKQPLAVVIAETGLIKGFTEGLIGMKLNEKRRIVIPSKLGYGANQRGPIPANSVLVFELEVVRLTPKDNP